MSRTCSPHHGVFESVLDRTVNLITDVLDTRVRAYNQRLVEIGLFSLSVDAHIVSIVIERLTLEHFLPFCVESHKSQFLPDTFNDILHTEIKLTTHDGCVRLAGKGVKELQTNAINLVVYV